jgi:hypothetical protein
MVLPEKEESDIAWHSLSSNDTAVFGLSGQIVSNDVSDPFFSLPSPLGFRQVDPHAIFACSMFCINCCIGIHPSW